ncbi:MAG: hypothetical protein BGO43_00170 [Gammaproteobacteria bacterium 39-13]|nr:hypothetical protein [Gammaproteobacteria bacterium]OJV96679.1 MAG: hypothetical protein BGO43_00170 [Gammaproteobacteria bacterium 39-13]
MNWKLFCAILVFPLSANAFGELKAMTDDEIRQNIIKASLKSFEGECPCPYSRDSKGRECGEDSEYFRSRGKILCYRQDISIADVNAYRLKYTIIDPKSVPQNRQILDPTEDAKKSQ